MGVRKWSLKLRGVYLIKLAPASVSHPNGYLISYCVWKETHRFCHNPTSNGMTTLSLRRFWKSAYALLVSVHREVNFISKKMVVLHLCDTFARLRNGVKFSLLWMYRNRSELAPVGLALVITLSGAIMQHKRIQGQKKKPQWTWYRVNTTLTFVVYPPAVAHFNNDEINAQDTFSAT